MLEVANHGQVDRKAKHAGSHNVSEVHGYTALILTNL